MATNQKSFRESKQYKKGTVGEKIAIEYLVSKGVIVYVPINDAAHPFDLLCAKGKKKISIAEIKSKPARIYYPDTGIDLKHYEEYCYIRDKHDMDVRLFFVDEEKGEIYTGLLAELEKNREINHKGKLIEYPLQQTCKNGDVIIYFPLEAMEKVADLDKDTINKLRSLSERNYKY